MKITKIAIVIAGQIILPCWLGAQTQNTIETKCTKVDYVKFGLSDGTRPKHILFAAVPCENINFLHDSFQNSLNNSSTDSPWEAFRFRRPENPVSEITSVEYLGKGAPLGPRAVVISLTKEMMDKYNTVGLDLDNAPASKRYAILVIKRGKLISEMLELARDQKAFDDYVKLNVVLFAYPEKAGAY
jgi:hypothetical protein